MSALQGAHPSRALLNRTMSPLSMCRQCLRNTIRNQYQYQHARPRISSSTTTTTRRAASTNSSKPIVLEQPDKFRPPSHPARLNRPRRPPAAYNQGPTSEEKARQQHRSYPHMFPNQGTFMHWFLTDRKIHLWITMGTLTILACITMTQSFVRTSPYAHLLPSLSSFPLHPIEYISETLSVLRLHIEYETQRTNESRQQKILDAQKRRLYRRAHGLEDLGADEDQGIDVRGLVPWDDGLTNKERTQGGREIVLTGADMIKLGMQPGEHQIEFMKRLESQGERLRMVKEKGVDAVLREEQEAARRGRAAAAAAGELAAEGQSFGQDQAQLEQELQPQPQPQPERRRRKLWLGIW